MKDASKALNSYTSSVAVSSFLSASPFEKVLCTLHTCRARFLSFSASKVSKSKNKRSNRESRAGGKSMFSTGDFMMSYRPYFGFAAASTVVREFNVVVMPALAKDTDCCSMTSWIAVRSFSSILSNSSMQQMPMSARTRAPPSRETSPVALSRVTAAVRPTPLEPLPVVYTERGAILHTCFSNWLFATPGSPMKSVWMSPRIFMPSFIVLVKEPMSTRSNAFFTSVWPKISGAMDRAAFSYRLPLRCASSTCRATSSSFWSCSL
mmetsp:Transcript_46916/g.92908  ORF Transcript_46916/g.92908 Transcript_46916/m.92908 type:complete len:264 (-) Transcript_46916:910-1701(-)